MHCFKVNGYAFRGNNSSIFIFASLLNGGQLLKKRICSCRSKFFPSRVDPFWMGYFSQESKQEITKVVALYKIAEKMEVYSFTINYHLTFCKKWQKNMGVYLFTINYYLYFAAEGEVLSPNFDVPIVNVTATSGATAILPCTINYIGDKVVGYSKQHIILAKIFERVLYKISRFLKI